MSVAEAEATRAEAGRIEAMGLVEAAGVKERTSVWEILPVSVVLAIREIAGKLHSIEHLNVTPDVLQTNRVKKRPTCSYDISTMSGTATADTRIAALNNIITSLNRQGNR